MEKGITSYFGYMGPIDERMKLIKEAGFERVMMDARKDFVFQNGTLANQVKMAKKAGLKLATLHGSYDDINSPYFWKEGDIGDKIEKEWINEIRLAGKYGFNAVVLHLVGNKSEIGLQRIKRLLAVCEEVRVPIAVENLNKTEIIEYVMDNIDNQYLQICYDIGHRNIHPPKHDLFDKYPKRIGAFHLHDNNGQHDMHTLNLIAKRKDVVYKWTSEDAINKTRKFIDWDYIAKKIVQYDLKVPLDYELINKVENRLDYTINFVINECYRQACILDERIAYYRVHPEEINKNKKQQTSKTKNKNNKK